MRRNWGADSSPAAAWSASWRGRVPAAMRALEESGSQGVRQTARLAGPLPPALRACRRRLTYLLREALPDPRPSIFAAAAAKAARPSRTMTLSAMRAPCGWCLLAGWRTAPALLPGPPVPAHPPPVAASRRPARSPSSRHGGQRSRSETSSGASRNTCATRPGTPGSAVPASLCSVPALAAVSVAERQLCCLSCPSAPRNIHNILDKYHCGTFHNLSAKQPER